MAFTKHGVLFESDPFIKECMNRGGISATDIDGGALVAEGAIVSGNEELYTLTFPAAGATRVGVAFNPSVYYDEIAGQRYNGITTDDRAYYNHAGDVVDYFFPTTGVEFEIQGANVEGETAPVVGNFLEVTATKGTYTIKAAQTANVPSFEVIKIKSKIYPTGDLTDDTEAVYTVKTRFNG